MPYKSFFTQGVCVLLMAQVSLDDLENRLGDFEVVGRQKQTRDSHEWRFLKILTKRVSLCR